MTVEHDVSEMLARYEETRLGSRGESARRISDGILHSGVVERMDRGNESLEHIARAVNEIDLELLGVATTIGVSAAVILDAVARTNTYLAACA